MLIGSREFSRRAALKYLGALAATAAGRDFLGAWLPVPVVQADAQNDFATIHAMHDAVSQSQRTAPYKPQFFKPGQFQTVEILTEEIIPTDDQPGAKQAKVADYIDFVVFSAAQFESSLQREWTEGLAQLDRDSQKRFGKAFRLASESDRVNLLTEMSAPEHDPSAHHEGYAFFRLVKDMTVEGFYTSKIGLIDVLNYQGMNYFADFPGCTHPEHQS
jgi:gluconate 2-dehydrogenase gamma chain